MADYVTDTMAFILHLEKRKMGAKAKSAYLNMEAKKDTIYIPTFVLAKLLYLSEKQRKTVSTITDISELHDRLIAAVAVHLQLRLITNDPVVTTSQHLNTMW